MRAGALMVRTTMVITGQPLACRAGRTAPRTATSSPRVMHVSHHAHYCEARSIGAAQPDGSADRVFLGPKCVRHGLIDHDHSRRAREYPAE